MFDTFAKYIISHQEIFAVLAGWFFASGETWLVSQLFPHSWKKQRRRIINISHSSAAAFFWTFVMWKILDYRHDDLNLVIGVASFGCAICTPMIQEIAIAFLNARLQKLSGNKKSPGIFKMMVKNLKFNSEK